MTRSVLVLDFDGTVCLGDEAPLGYARELAEHPGASDLVAQVRAFLDDPTADQRLRDADDGYQAVAMLAREAGVPPDAYDPAYRASRAALDPAALSAPDGLPQLLAELPAYGVHRVLCTNAPAQQLAPILTAIGLDGVLDEVLTDAGKPRRMVEHLTALLAATGLTVTPEGLLSVGDIWANDLAPALELGCATAYVDPFGRDRGPAHARARRLPDLYDDIRDWACDPAGFVGARPLDANGSAGAVPTAVLDSTSTGPGKPRRRTA